VGSALLRALGSGAVGTYRSRPREGLRQLDVTNSGAIAYLLQDVQPRVVYFPAAEANVDWCETHPDEAHALNVVPAITAQRATRDSGARFVFFSTDYVFDGERGPYVETDAVNPLSVYAKHKRKVEESVLDAGDTVVRTTTVYGREIPPGKNFVLRVIARIKAGEPVTAPADQLSTPTWADELAAAAVGVAERGGVWHVAGPDLIARDDFARLVAQIFALDERLVSSVATPELRQAARRPLRGGLYTAKLASETGATLLPLRSALERFRDSL
jgi:dTDP-4-dehydrorhamnose reductase